MTIAGLVCLGLAIEHFTHEYQPRGLGEKIPGYDHISGPTLAEIPQTEFTRRAGESDLAYVKRITQIVHLATYHCPPTNFGLSFIETAVENVMIRLHRDPQFDMGLVDRKRIRCGFCSEQSVVLASILRENGMDARALALTGHVAALVVVDGVEYLADPDYGVGPYPYNLPVEKLRSLYRASSLPEMTNIVVPMIANREDDAPYYSPKFFEDLKTTRNEMFFNSNGLAGLLAFMGVVLLFGCYFKITSIVN
jgi:hypothetical protein